MFLLASFIMRSLLPGLMLWAVVGARGDVAAPGKINGEPRRHLREGLIPPTVLHNKAHFEGREKYTHPGYAPSFLSIRLFRCCLVI